MLARMTAANVKAAAKRYIDNRRRYQAIMLPSKDARKKTAPKDAPKKP
jgi:hypothetical protein